MEYKYPKGTFRARCLKVVDGDTVDLLVDVGFHCYREERFRLKDIDTPELRDRDPQQRTKAKAAKQVMIDLLMDNPLKEWNVMIEVDKDPDSFGRYVCVLYVKHKQGWDVSVNDWLVETGHADVRIY